MNNDKNASDIKHKLLWAVRDYGTALKHMGQINQDRLWKELLETVDKSFKEVYEMGQSDQQFNTMRMKLALQDIACRFEERQSSHQACVTLATLKS